VLSDRDQANAVTLRGWAKRPQLPQLPELWKLRAAAVTVYPMYRGLARLVGMDSLDGGDSLETQIATVREHWDHYDFFFIHFKDTDSAGEDGDFRRKSAAIGRFDAALPGLLDLKPNVLIVTGDHSTPAVMAAHSWHPVPVVVSGPRSGRDDTDRFGERWCRAGALGIRPSMELLPILMANAGHLAKYGA
jgi:2,3-bisphosphoglycerate-independent phosphoglycerate mutase